MAKKARQKADASNYAAQLEGWLSDFKPVKIAAEQSKKADEGARQALYRALEELFSFGRRLIESDDPEIAKAFVTKMGGEWGAVAQKNPFVPLVKIAFNHAKPAPQSKYAKVLRLAHALSIEEPLSDWLASHENGLEGWYEEADEHLSPESQASRDEKEQALVQDGMAQLRKQSLSKNIKLTKPIDTSSEFVTAIVRVVGSDQVQIVDFLDTKETDVAPVLKRYGHKKRSTRSTLAKHSLFRLFRAVEFIHRVSTPPGSDERRLIIINAREHQGTSSIRLYSAATMYNFMFAEAELTGHDFKLAPGTSIYLDYADAEKFVRGFLQDGDWSLETNSNGSCTLVPSNNKLARITMPLLLDEQCAGIFIGTDAFTSAAATRFDYGSAQHVLGWLKAMREFVASNNKGKAAPADVDSVLKLSSSGSELTASAPRAPKVAPASLLPIPSSYSLPADRYIRVRDIQNLAEVVASYDLQMDGSITDADVSATFVALEAKADADLLRCHLPLAINKQGDYPKCCTPFRDE